MFFHIYQINLLSNTKSISTTRSYETNGEVLMRLLYREDKDTSEFFRHSYYKKDTQAHHTYMIGNITDIIGYIQINKNRLGLANKNTDYEGNFAYIQYHPT